nr:uncharacterized protein LOC113810910 isoform X4 [Penaeus vannamei]
MMARNVAAVSLFVAMCLVAADAGSSKYGQRPVGIQKPVGVHGGGGLGVPTCWRSRCVHGVGDSVVPTVLEDSVVPTVLEESVVSMVLEDSVVPTVLEELVVSTALEEPVVSTVLEESVVSMVLEDSVVSKAVEGSVVSTALEESVVSTVLEESVVSMVLEDSVEDSVVSTALEESVVSKALEDSVVSTALDPSTPLITLALCLVTASTTRDQRSALTSASTGAKVILLTSTTAANDLTRDRFSVPHWITFVFCYSTLM